jgi:hypothetical protein
VIVTSYMCDRCKTSGEKRELVNRVTVAVDVNWSSTPQKMLELDLCEACLVEMGIGWFFNRRSPKPEVAPTAEEQLRGIIGCIAREELEALGGGS